MVGFSFTVLVFTLGGTISYQSWSIRGLGISSAYFRSFAISSTAFLVASPTFSNSIALFSSWDNIIIRSIIACFK